jgi:uncharacterized RDD family membrane protein YckC
MRKIDITTTQNVTIEYELATVIERTAATIIDNVIVSAGSLILFGILSLFGVPLNYIHLLIPGSFFYHLLMETLNHGQSFGKKILNIRVVKINGERPSFFDFVMRTTFRAVDIGSTFGALALITVSSSEKGQRIGDFLADTTVVKLANINRFSLNQLLSMDALKTYTPSYPDVVKFKEEEMLLIKETLERYKKYPNDSHLDAIAMLVKKIEGQLSIVAPPDKTLFLNTLIRDYVSLTR